jgi:hypothetical protein
VRPLAINEAEELAEKFGERVYCAELHRLHGVFLTALGAAETEIEAKGFALARIMIAIGSEDCWHLQLAQRWILETQETRVRDSRESLGRCSTRC